jgi:hypothetical protein
MTYLTKTSNILYPSDEINIDCKTCFEHIRQDLKATESSRVHFRITSYESEESSEPLEKVCLTNKFSVRICDRYSKSVQINIQHEGVFLFGRVDVLNDNNQTYSCIPRIYLIKFNQIFYMAETKYTVPDNDNQTYFDILICRKEKINYLPHERKDIDFFLANDSFTLNGSL